MANVYLARFHGPAGFEKMVAIKRVHEHLTDREDFVQMFLDEARVAARICHPNVVQVLELGVHEQSYYMAMEYVPGETLLSLVQASRLSAPIAAQIISSAAAGLHAAHELVDAQGQLLDVVHRDVSPSNILVGYDGTSKVADFGVALARDNLHKTRVGMLKGKLGYMSPEQARGEKVDRRSDVFALGIVLYEASTRKRLFKAESDIDTIRRIASEPIPPPSKRVEGYPAELEQIIMRALERDPEKRYQSARTLHDHLEDFLKHTAGGSLTSAIAELMDKHFGERREEKRRLLASCTTDEISLPKRVPMLVEEGTAVFAAVPEFGTAPPDAPLAQPFSPKRLWLLIAISAVTLTGCGLLWWIWGR